MYKNPRFLTRGIIFTRGVLYLLCKLLSLFCDEFRRKPVFTENIVGIVTVEEFLFKTEVSNLHVGISVETRYLLAKAAVENSVLQRDDRLVSSFQALQKFFVDTGYINRVDERGLYSGALFNDLSRLHANPEERSQRDYRNVTALLINLVLVKVAVILFRLVVMHNSTGHAYCHRVLALLKAPVQHRDVFLIGGGGAPGVCS